MNKNNERAAKVADKIAPSSKDIKNVKDAIKEAQKPVVLNKVDLKPGELDIRKLSDADYRQVMFRLECQKVSYLKSIDEDLIDIQRSLFIVLKEGYNITDIAKAFEDVMATLQKAVKKENPKA